MSDYGAQLFDAEGRQVTRIDKTNYHFWGWIDFYPSRNQQTISVFGIPSSVPVALFVWAELRGQASYANFQGSMSASNSGSVWTFSFANGPVYDPATGNAFTHGRLFVFVPAQYVRAGAWGVQCFSSAGVKFFDSSRPLLQFCAFVREAPSSTSLASVTYFNRVPAHVASPMNNALSGDYLVFPDGLYHVRFIGCPTSMSNGYYWLWDYTLPPGASGSSGKFRPTNVPLIDADYYTRFGSVGQW